MQDRQPLNITRSIRQYGEHSAPPAQWTGTPYGTSWVDEWRDPSRRAAPYIESVSLSVCPSVCPHACRMWLVKRARIHAVELTVVGGHSSSVSRSCEHSFNEEDNQNLFWSGCQGDPVTFCDSGADRVWWVIWDAARRSGARPTFFRGTVSNPRWLWTIPSGGRKSESVTFGNFPEFKNAVLDIIFSQDSKNLSCTNNHPTFHKKVCDQAQGTEISPLKAIP